MENSSMRMFVFEGSPSQLADVAKSLGASAQALTNTVAMEANAGAQAPLSAAKTSEDEDGPTVMTTEFARKALARRPLSSEQSQMLAILGKASPNWTLATTLQSTLKYSPAQFAGLMGAFGRRLTHTENYVDGSFFFDQEWLPELGCYRYRLPASVIAALRAEKLI